MIELTWIPGALRALGGLYVILALTALIFALVKPQTGMRKAMWSLGVIALFGVLPGISFYVSLKEEQAKREAERHAYQMKLAGAMAHFEMRCKNAGEKIVRTLGNVEGIVWMKWRPERIDRVDQFKLDDPYGTDCFGEECIKRLLRVTQGAELNPDDAKQHARGYQYVETIDPRDDKRYRYVAVIKLIAKRTPDEIEQYKKNSGGRDPGPDVYGFALERQPIDRYSARYGITWEDISTREDREWWIAGGSLKVFDLQTHQVIAERIGYLIDPGQGSREGARDPWGWAKSYSMPCPKTNEYSWTFATKVAQPIEQGK